MPIYLQYSEQKIDRTLGYSTPAWLDEIIVVTRGSKHDHEKKLFDILNDLEMAGYGANKKIQFLHEPNKTLGWDMKLTKTESNRTKQTWKQYYE